MTAKTTRQAAKVSAPVPRGAARTQGTASSAPTRASRPSLPPAAEARRDGVRASRGAKTAPPVPPPAPAEIRRREPRATKGVAAAAKAIAPAAAGEDPAPPAGPGASGGAGELWRMAGRHGVAYVRDAALAGELLATDPKNLAKEAMAVYYDRRGRAFAWQVRFDTGRWDEVMRRLG